MTTAQNLFNSASRTIKLLREMETELALLLELRRAVAKNPAVARHINGDPGKELAALQGTRNAIVVALEEAINNLRDRY